MKKVLFWDFDGTLVHSDSLWSRTVHRVLASLGYPVDYGALRGYLLTGYTWHRPEVDHLAHTGTAWWERLYRHFEGFYRQLGMPETEMFRANELVRETVLSADSYTIYPDAFETLAACHALGYENYVLSNNYPELESVLNTLGFASSFAGAVVSACIGYDKPRPELFDYAKRLAGNPDWCAMIGDNPAADIEGGRAAGMTTFLVHNPAESAADFTVETLAQIPGILRELELPMPALSR